MKLFSFKSAPESENTSGQVNYYENNYNNPNDNNGDGYYDDYDDGTIGSVESSGTHKSILRRNSKKNTARNVSWSNTFDTYEEGGVGVDHQYSDSSGGGDDSDYHGDDGDTFEGQDTFETLDTYEESRQDDNHGYAYDPNVATHDDQSRQDNHYNNVYPGAGNDVQSQTFTYDGYDDDGTMQDDNMSVSVSVSEDMGGVEIEHVAGKSPSSASSNPRRGAGNGRIHSRQAPPPGMLPPSFPSPPMMGTTTMAPRLVQRKEILQPDPSANLENSYFSQAPLLTAPPVNTTLPIRQTGRKQVLSPIEERMLPPSRVDFRNLACASSVSDATLEARKDKYGRMDNDDEGGKEDEENNMQVGNVYVAEKDETKTPLVQAEAPEAPRSESVPIFAPSPPQSENISTPPPPTLVKKEPKKNGLASVVKKFSAVVSPKKEAASKKEVIVTKEPEPESEPAPEPAPAIATVKPSDIFMPHMITDIPTSIMHTESDSIRSLGSFASIDELTMDGFESLCDDDAAEEVEEVEAEVEVEAAAKEEAAPPNDHHVNFPDSECFASFDENPHYDTSAIHALSDDESIVSLKKKEHNYETSFKKQQETDRSSVGQYGLILPQFLDDAISKVAMWPKVSSFSMFESWDAEASKGNSEVQGKGTSIKVEDSNGKDDRNGEVSATSASRSSGSMDSGSRRNEGKGMSILSKNTGQSQLSAATGSSGGDMSNDGKVAITTDTAEPPKQSPAGDDIEVTPQTAERSKKSIEEFDIAINANVNNDGNEKKVEEITSSKENKDGGASDGVDDVPCRGSGSVQEKVQADQNMKNSKKEMNNEKVEANRGQEDESMDLEHALPEIVIMNPSLAGSEDVYLNEINETIDNIYGKKTRENQSRSGLWGWRKKSKAGSTKQRSQADANAFTQIQDIFHPTTPLIDGKVYDYIDEAPDDDCSVESCITTESILSELRVIESTAKMMYQQMVMNPDVGDENSSHNSISALFLKEVDQEETELVLKEPKPNQQQQREGITKEEAAKKKKKKRNSLSRFFGRLIPKKKKWGLRLFGVSGSVVWTPKDNDPIQE